MERKKIAIVFVIGLFVLLWLPVLSYVYPSVAFLTSEAFLSAEALAEAEAKEVAKEDSFEKSFTNFGSSFGSSIFSPIGATIDTAVSSSAFALRATADKSAKALMATAERNLQAQISGIHRMLGLPAKALRATADASRNIIINQISKINNLFALLLKTEENITNSEHGEKEPVGKVRKEETSSQKIALVLNNERERESSTNPH